MASSEVDRATRKIEREAKKRSIDLDDVRVADDVDADGTVLRVLETDAPNEEDQVGFQIAIPPGPNGYSMFETNLKKYWPALKDHLEGESDGTTSELEESQDATTQDRQEGSRDAQSQDSGRDGNSRNATPNQRNQSSVPEHTLTLSVGLDDGSLEDLQSEFDAFLERIEEETVDEERVDELEDHVDDHEERLSDIEERLSLLGGE